MGSRVLVGLVLAAVGFVSTAWGVTGGDVGMPALLGVALLVVGATLVALQYVVWTNTRYVITTDELYKKRGIVSRDVTQFRIDRVQNTTLEQDVVGRLLGYGDLTIYTAGSGDPELTFERTPNPERANGALNQQLSDLVDGSRSA
ncbi:PH domain-containing protein [Halobiforma nitratireducens]|uniref:PH domain-containing protein n=1 Tax=Halobiforma nitratireducens TaxID=130048 RepID=UPI001872CF56